MSAPVELSKRSNVVKNDVVKTGVYNKLAEKANNIDTIGFFKKICTTKKKQS